MKLILHAGENQGYRRQLKTIIEDTFPKGEIVLTDDGAQLSEVLCRPLHNVLVLIAFICDSEGFDPLLALKPLFENIKIILIFCERVDEIQASALLLEPLYTTHSDNNFQDVISVLKRIEQKSVGLINQPQIK